MAGSLDHPPADLDGLVASLSRSAPGTTLSVRTTTVTSDGSHATASYHAHVDVGGFGGFDWDGHLALAAVNGKWRVQWSPDVLFPGLADDQRLVVHTTWPTRAPILDASGSPLVSDQQAVSVGLEPDHIKDLNVVKSTLAQLLAVDPAAVDRALAAPGVQPSSFVPVITLRTDHYDSVRPQLAPVPGIVFQRTNARFAVEDGIAVQVLGRVGEITADRLTQLGPPYAVGDRVGLSGLELVYETRLAGRPSGDVDIADGKGTIVRTVQHFPGVNPQPVQLTIDTKTQIAADHALQGVMQPAALVALDATTGQLRAVVSTASDQEFDRALDGQYPPGSTFKIVTTAALLNSGATADTQASCPPSLVVGGRTFPNFEGEAAGSIPLHHAFAISCNTAFIGLAAKLPANALADTATLFGFGATYKLALPTGRVVGSELGGAGLAGDLLAGDSGGGAGSVGDDFGHHRSQCADCTPGSSATAATSPSPSSSKAEASEDESPRRSPPSSSPQHPSKTASTRPGCDQRVSTKRAARPSLAAPRRRPSIQLVRPGAPARDRLARR